MKKVIIASLNPVKINAAKEGFERMFPMGDFSFEGCSVPSDVSEQPMTDRETKRGAMNRAINARTEVPNADYWVGIEGGIEVVDDEMSAFAWIVISSMDKTGKARTATFFLPRKIKKLVESGMELGEADDLVFEGTNSKQKNGAVGILTGDVLNRTVYYTEAVILALIPFKNEAHY